MSNKKYELSASILCLNPFYLKEELNSIKKKGFDYIHFDIMDGHFAPSIGLSLSLLKKLTKYETIPIDVHLMISNPEEYIDDIIGRNISIITFHYEISSDISLIVQRIRKHKVRVGIALRPFTPVSVIKPIINYLDLVLIMAYPPGSNNNRPFPEVIERIKMVKSFYTKSNRENIRIAVDGGIDSSNINEYYNSGANFFVVGTSGLKNINI